MAIVLQPQIPIPDRTRQQLRIVRDGSGMIDVGWCEGVLTDGRAFRAEMWSEGDVSSLTIFFSTLGLEDLEPDEICGLVEAEGLVAFPEEGERHCAADKYYDNSGQELWSVNIVIGIDRQTFVSDTVPIFGYSDSLEPDTLFGRRRGV